MLRFLIVVAIFLLILVPIWRFMRLFSRKIKSEITEESSRDEFENIKAQKDELLKKVADEEDELTKQQNEHKKLRKDIEDGKI